MLSHGSHKTTGRKFFGLTINKPQMSLIFGHIYIIKNGDHNKRNRGVFFRY